MREQRNEGRAKVPAPSKTCGCEYCDMPTAVAFGVAIVNGTLRTGAGSEFLDNGSPKAGVDFKYFITRCADCYLRDLYRSGKGSRVAITGKNPDYDYDTVKQYWRDNGLDEPRRAA